MLSVQPQLDSKADGLRNNSPRYVRARKLLQLEEYPFHYKTLAIHLTQLPLEWPHPALQALIKDGLILELEAVRCQLGFRMLL